MISTFFYPLTSTPEGVTSWMVGKATFTIISTKRAEGMTPPNCPTLKKVVNPTINIIYDKLPI